MAANSALWEQANELVGNACKQDNNLRLKVGPQLINFLDGKGKLDGHQSDQLVDAMTDWLHSSNFKISLLAVDVFTVLVFKLSSIDRHAPTILSALLEALKTSNDQVRVQVQNLLGAITDKITPAVVADKICVNGLTHKAWRVREETLIWIINTLEIHGKESLQVSKFLPQVCSLVLDPNVDVRDRAVQLLVEIYKHVGDRLKLDLEKKQLVPDVSKRKVLFQKFEEAKKNNLMKTAPNTQTAAPPDMNGDTSESSTLARVNGAVKSASSSKPAGTGAVNRSNSASSTSGKNLAVRKPSGSGPVAGTVSSSAFEKNFEEVKPATIYSSRSLDEDLTKLTDTLENTDNDWKVRVNELKKLCSILKANAHTSFANEFNNHLKDITRVLSISVKDLRSQVSREACITVALACQTLACSAVSLAEGCLASLFSIVPNSAKIIASSGCTALMYIVRHVHSSKLLPSLVSYQTTKSIPCRFQLSQMLEDILRSWDASVLDKYFTNVEDCMVKLLSDADEKTRSFARKAFFALRDRFPNRADILMATLDPKVQRKLMGESSYGSSVNSLAASRSQSSLGSQESLGGRSVSSLSTRMGVKNPTNAGAFKKSYSTHDIASSNAALSLSPPPQKPSEPTHPPDPRPFTNSSMSNFGGGAHITPITPGGTVKYRRKSSPRIGVSSLKHNLSPVAQSPLVATNAGVRKRHETASLGHEMEMESTEGDNSAFLDTSSAESGFGEEALGANQQLSSSSANVQQTVKRTVGPGDRSNVRASRMAQSQPASRSGSRGTSPQTARLNILTSPTVVSSSSASQPDTHSYTPYANRSGAQSKIGSSPASGSLSSARRSGIPRSLNASREHSPSSGYGTRSLAGNRSTLGSSSSQQRSLYMTPQSASRFQKIQNERQHNSVSSMRMLSDTPEARKAIESALNTSPRSLTSSRLRHESYGTALSDDDSDICSIQSFDSRYDREFENMSEVLEKCSAQDWSERKEGLLMLQAALRSRQCQLTRSEIKKATEIFTRMFGDPHVKVLSLFLEVLADFVSMYFEALHDWLSLLLPKLLQKTGAENLLNSGLTKVNRCLEIVRGNFPLDLQFLILMKYIADQTQTKSLKVKMALLKYLLSVIEELTPHEFVNSPDTRQALQLILSWSTDKNSDIRRNAVGVVTSLFDLNTAEFNALQNALPKKELQHLANNILHQYVNNFETSSATNNNLNSSSHSLVSGGAGDSYSSPNNYRSLPRNYKVLRSPLQHQPPGSLNLSSNQTRRVSSGSGTGAYSNVSSPNLLNSSLPTAGFVRGGERRSSTSSNKSGVGAGGGAASANLAALSPGRSLGGAGAGAGVGGAGDDSNAQTPNSLLHKTTSDIHKYFDTAAVTAEGYDSGIPSMPNSNVDLHGDLGSNNRIYDPSHYQDRSILESPDFLVKRTFDLDDDYSSPAGRNVVDQGGDASIVKSVVGSAQNSNLDMQQQDDEKLVEAILQELSHHNSRVEQRKSALISLTKLIKEGNPVVWEEHFKMCLMMLFETMSDREPAIRALVLRVLKEFLKHQQHRFQQYAEITILKTLDAHKDSHKDVVRASEELTYSVVNAIEHARCLQVLCPVVAAGDFPINQTAVKMLTKIIEDSPPEEVETFVEQVCPALMKAYEHQESSVRKDSVYGLVAVHQKVGQAMLDQYTNSLSHGKLKLLRLYISRASSGSNGTGGAASNQTSQASNSSSANTASGDKKTSSSANHSAVTSLSQPQQVSTASKN